MSLSAILLAVAAPAVLGDPAQDARAHALEMEIRCIQSQNEPIAQSTSEIAADMRTLVRERLAAGDGDAVYRDVFRERYGDFVLFRPPVGARTWLLWATPVLLFLIGLWAILSIRARVRADGAPLTPEEGER